MLAISGPRTLYCDVEPNQMSKDPVQSEKNWGYSFNNSFSGPEAGKGLPFSVYKTFNGNVGLFKYIYLKDGLMEAKLDILLQHGSNKEPHGR